MEHILVQCLMLLYMTGTVILAEDKRVLLHSDQDLYQVISSLQAEVARLNSSFQTQTATMQSEIETLKHSPQFANNIASTLLTTLATLNTSLTAEIAALKSSLQAETTKTSSLQAQVATLTSLLQTETAMTSSLHTDVSSLKSSLQAEKAATSSLRADVASLNSSLQTETTKSSSLQSEVATLKSSLQTETATTTSLRAEVTSVNSSLQTEKAIMSSLQAETSSLQSKVTTLETNSVQLQHAAGSTYVRWGRTSCPGNGTDIIYKGRMAGSKWNEPGGGSNSLCLPDDPTWSKYVDGMTGWNIVAGTEIGVKSSDANVLFGKHIDNQNLPCAVCRTIRSSTVMIPGRASCYPGWTIEYRGYVVAGGKGHSHNTDFVCLDAGLEFVPNSAGDDGDQMVLVAEVECGSAGSLSCPPYVNGRELACAVCSK